MSPSIDACPKVPSLRLQSTSMSSAAICARRWSLRLAAILLPSMVSVAASSRPGPSVSSPQPVKNYGLLPLRFEANQGQADAAVRFSARGAGYAVYLTDHEAVLALRSSGKRDADVVRMQLQGANTVVAPIGLDRLPGESNYFIGNDPSQWRTSVPASAKVRFSAVYDGIDLVYYGNQQRLEYDFAVAPHADPSSIRLHFDGSNSCQLDAAGNLVITAPGGQIAFHKPVVYQITGGRRHSVAGSFKLLAGDSIGFALGRYNHDQPLVIDPTLVYSTYLGGSNSDTMNAIAIDASGNAYVTGTTASTDYPVTTGAFQTKFSTAFVTKLNPTGTAVL
jgi:Beta-propeller repeat